MLCRKPAPSPLLHFSGKIVHGLLRDDAAFPSGKGSFGFIDCNENFRTGALTFFPQGKGFPHRIFFAVKPSALNSLPDKGLLVLGELLPSPSGYGETLTCGKPAVDENLLQGLSPLGWQHINSPE
jgi:hypothetical protein